MEFEFDYTTDSIWISTRMENYEWIEKAFEQQPDERLTLFWAFDVEKEDVDIEPDDEGATVSVRIGSLEDGIYRIGGEVLGCEHSLFIRPDNKLDDIRFFRTHYKVKVMKTILETIGADTTIGNEDGDLTYSTLLSTVKSFPTRTEIKYYIETRISTIVREDLQLIRDREERYRRYIDERRKLPVKGLIDINELDLKKFEYLKEEMEYMLNDPKKYNETAWQVKIKDIVCVLFPQYIVASRERELTEVFGHQKRVDFLLVNSSGYVDVMEIKKPDVPLLKERVDSHNNILPSTYFSDCVMQVETYLYSLSISNKITIRNISRLIKEKDGIDIELNVLNPRGLMVMGHFQNGLSKHQAHAIEIMRRQYAHITDIITYDDLLERLRNIIACLKSNIDSKT